MTSSSAGALNWAVVGTGFISQLIANDLALTPGAVCYAVVSRDQTKANAFADERGFPVAYSDLHRALADPDVDVVYVGTPHATHARIAVAALEAGKHVLVEKPIAVDEGDARRIADAAARSGRFAMEGMWMRFLPAYRAALEEASSGAIGDVRSVRASFGLPFDAPESPRWSAERASSTLLDQAIYPVTLALDVLGAPGRVWASGRIRSDGVDLAEHMTFDYADGRFAQLAASMVDYAEPTATISGTEGWITIPAPFWSAFEYQKRSGPIPDALARVDTTTFTRDGFGYVPMLAAVTEAIMAGLTEHPTHPLADSVATLSVLDTIRLRIIETAHDQRSTHEAHILQ
ncbi:MULTISPECIES: Gfo/Idh/MocA family protein [unclassified Leifsonia]|uniref:Gfo/Idh/MocA family protein n=1 Tax=unclassified Leifsonia TaxID=2663824 RepID=UPI00037EEE6A|nr:MULTISPECIES: Gfo/Idh/MocA family oxidoreductase [unclassified Leifsonia]TDP98480.1 putative dehydrogenase [Leifsonia sp. 115AMFTsu3.1]